MAPMASNDTTPVARNTASLAFMGRGPVDRCFPAAKSLMGGKMDMVPNPFLMVDLVAVHASMSGRYGAPGPPGHNTWPQRTAS